MKKMLLVLMACMVFLGIGFSKGYATVYLYDSPLTMNETITDLGGGIYSYDLSFVNTDASNIWHFMVWTMASTTLVSASLPYFDNGHAIGEVDSAYDARNIQPGITWTDHMWALPFGGTNGIQPGQGGIFSFTTNYYSSDLLYGYETHASGYAVTRTDHALAAVGHASTSVPEPATLLLLGAGLIGLVGFRKFRK